MLAKCASSFLVQRVEAFVDRIEASVDGIEARVHPFF